MTTNQDLLDRVAGQTVPSQFLRTVAEHGDLTALRWKDDQDAWHELTFATVADQVARVAAGLASLGVGHGDRVVMMMLNRPSSM